MSGYRAVLLFLRFSLYESFLLFFCDIPCSPNEQETEATRTTSRAFVHELVQKLRRTRLRILFGRSKLPTCTPVLCAASSIGDAASSFKSDGVENVVTRIKHRKHRKKKKRRKEEVKKPCIFLRRSLQNQVTSYANVTIKDRTA